MRIHFSGKHPLELELLDLEPKPVHIGLDSLNGALVALGRRKIEQFRGVVQAARQSIESSDDLFQLGAFLAEFLRALRSVPDAGLL
jgi:hypothetical protein